MHESRSFEFSAIEAVGGWGPHLELAYESREGRPQTLVRYPEQQRPFDGAAKGKTDHRVTILLDSFECGRRLAVVAIPIEERHRLEAQLSSEGSNFPHLILASAVDELDAVRVRRWLAVDGLETVGYGTQGSDVVRPLADEHRSGRYCW